MKKVIGLIVLAIMVILPMNVHAGYSFEFKKTSETETTLTAEISVTLTGSSTLSKIGGNLVMKHVTLSQVTVADSKFTDVSTGNTLLFKSSEKLTAGTYKIATITFAKDGTATADDECYVGWTPCIDETGSFVCQDTTIVIEEDKTCKIVDGKYYGKDGNEVTEEVYNKECVTNPQTGSFVPYVVIAAGIALAVGVFTVSRKNNTLYKI